MILEKSLYESSVSSGLIFFENLRFQQITYTQNEIHSIQTITLSSHIGFNGSWISVLSVLTVPRFLGLRFFRSFRLVGSLGYGSFGSYGSVRFLGWYIFDTYI